MMAMVGLQPSRPCSSFCILGSFQDLHGSNALEGLEVMLLYGFPELCGH